MVYSALMCYKNLITELNERAIKHSVHEFKSGVKMVDMWYKELFYVIQIENDFVGASLVNDNNIGFDTNSDLEIFTTEGFITKIRDIFNQH
jgi:hypothetical protein